VLDPDRKKMSKSQGNALTPEPLIDQFGSDSVRYWAARARLGVDTAFDEQVFKVGKRLCTKLFNASKFTIGRIEGIDPSQLGANKVIHETDRAVIAELRPMLERVTKAFNQFDYAQALQLTEEFFWSVFCDNYLELAKSRTYEEELSEGRLSAASTLRIVHRTLLRMLAPFVPYLADEIWSWAYSGDSDLHESVHASPWPTLDEFASIPAPQQDQTYSATLVVLDAVRKAKADASLSMKAPVPKVMVTATDTICEALNSTTDDIKGMLHVEELVIEAGDPGEGLAEVAVELGESEQN
jgi:valyl-tRNA synthetase